MHHAAWNKQMFSIFLYVPLQSNFSLGKLGWQQNYHLTLQSLQALCPLIWRAVFIASLNWPIRFCSVKDSYITELTRKSNFPKQLSEEITEILSFFFFFLITCWIISCIISFYDQRWNDSNHRFSCHTKLNFS